MPRTKLRREEATTDKVAVALAQADRLQDALAHLTSEITAVKLWKSRIGKLTIVGAVLTFMAFTAAAVGIGANLPTRGTSSGSPNVGPPATPSSRRRYGGEPTWQAKATRH